MPRLTVTRFADLLGTTSDQFSEDCRQKILAHDWSYSVLGGAERDAVVVDMLRRIDERRLTMVANDDKSRWIKGWGENLQAFREQKGDLDALVPKYIRPNQPVRLFQDFVLPTESNFERHWYEIFRQWFLETHLGGFDHIFEFGCGSGYNLVTLAQMFPQSTIHGLDWVEPPVHIANELRTVKGMNTRGHLFDFFNPDQSLDIPANSAILTIGAMEQTGTRWDRFLDFLIAKKPRRVFHIEPIYEWYDEDNLVDYTAAKAHLVRNFMRGYAPRLRELERQGTIKIHRAKRAFFGSIVLEGYSQLAWSLA